MRKLLIAIIFGVLSSLPALANWTGKDATPATITFYNPAVCTSVVCVPVFQITDGTNQVTLTTAGADGVSNTLTGVPAYSRNLLWNGTTWDRQQGIGGAASVTVASSAVASGAYASGAFASGAFAVGSIANGANPVEGTITTAHGCLIAGYTMIGCLGQLDDDIKAAGSISQATQGTTNGVTNGANNTNTVAASASAFVLSATQGGGTGATGDYLSHCVIQPGTTSPGAVTIADNATTIFSFAGGASSVSNLVPFAIPAGAVSKSGGWKITTGTNVTLACIGKFS